ncbi:GIY-YIG nuclease family protein [Streptomyces chilikensis]|uniref:GIY-YIG nuclease family protein n=1 Tax=Streptomyces chilikensis TaxID=1194079 RepID=A0ABV3ERI0_9ACTN
MNVNAATSGLVQGTVPAESSRDGHTALYRFFDEQDVLLYVGITDRLTVRFREHSHHSKWWPLAVSHRVEWLAGRALADRTERQVIREEKPLFNVLHTPRARLPLSEETGRQDVAANGGNSLLDDLKKHFLGRPFTALDAHKVSALSHSAVARNLKELAACQVIFPIGTRSLVSPEGRKRTRTLYTLAVHEWVDEESGRPLPQERIPQSEPKRRPRKPTVGPRLDCLSLGVPSQAPAQRQSLPDTVTFDSGAELLIRLGLVDHITADGVRYLARTAANWPFGDGRPYTYRLVANTRTMDTGPFLDFFRSGPRRGGRGRK